MTRNSYLYKPDHPLADENGFVDKTDYYQYQYMSEPDMRAMIGNQVVTINFISDTMEPTRHMADGKYYTSKKKFRNETKARGCIEIGNEIPTVLKPRRRNELSKAKRKEDIRRAIYELKNGRNIKAEVMG